MLTASGEIKAEQVIQEFRAEYQKSDEHAFLVATELCDAAALIEENRSLTRILTQSSGNLQSKIGILQNIFGQKVDKVTFDIIAKLTDNHWLDVSSLNDALEVVSLDAYISLAEKLGILKQVQDELLQFYQMLLQNAPIRDFLSNKTVPYMRRKHMLLGLLTGKMHPVSVALSCLATEAVERTRYLVALRWIQGEIAKRRELVVANLNTSYTLSDEQIKRLEAVLIKKIGSKVQLNIIIDENETGLMKLDFKSVLIDGSLGQKMKAFTANVNAGKVKER
ncbi:MAG: F0F1 ATP synthase subunit delta [Bifidobacteriaceae bacterium]|jgi:F-type H+-transporting ATPase subunit delta|nr:F0F1 ATP synthase subunit delta [Bifidobacteriaceae bacterium]